MKHILKYILFEIFDFIDILYSLVHQYRFKKPKNIGQ